MNSFIQIFDKLIRFMLSNLYARFYILFALHLISFHSLIVTFYLLNLSKNLS